jgi:inositol phosphorylceramide mannosyltransferase catalytic subunit
MVPRTIHQIWIGPEPLPKEHRPWIASWKRHHPGWEHRLWTEDDLPEDPIRPEILERLRAPVERADILRLEILYRHGGVYVDTDVECLRPVDGIVGDADFVVPCLKPGRATNTFIASVPGHSLLERALRELRPMEVYWTTWADSSALKDVAGPSSLRRLLKDYADVKLLEPAVFFPATPEERETAVGVHHLARSWHNATALRTAMLQAERRLEAARAELAKEKRAHEATKKRLAKLEERIERVRAGKAGIRDKLALLRRFG